MKRINWQVLLGIVLISLSVIFYLIHYWIFRDAHHIFLYLIGDIAFIFVEVLLVTLIIHQLLREKEKRAVLKKLNMVIGAFFSEVGTGLLKMVSDIDQDAGQLRRDLILAKEWPDKKFIKMSRQYKDYEFKLVSSREFLEKVRGFLMSKMEFLLRLLENPNLLEHDSFTNLLWAVFHLSEELAYRESIEALPASDQEHLVGDIKRVYNLLIYEWLFYMRHLKNNYPYLFSLAIRTNPFNLTASPIVT